MILCVVFLGSLLYYRPFAEKKDQFFNVLLESLILVLNIVVLITEIVLEGEDADGETGQILGWILISLSLVIFLTFQVLIFIEIYQQIKAKCGRKK